ncbi:MAG: GH25 family lysozyme, partial [Actinocatenispora sp.]
AAASAVTVAARPPAVATQIEGVDVAAHTGVIDWDSVRAAGNEFAWVTATQGSGGTNPQFPTDYGNAGQAGLVRGAGHFAVPGASSGGAQADFFVGHGGGWSADHRTLPGALDLEYNPFGTACYGLSTAAMVAWIGAFLDRYHADTGRWPVIYTTASWWQTCTGDDASAAASSPLWIARPANGSGVLPGGWPDWAFWQYDSGQVPGSPGELGLDHFNGGQKELVVLADGTS